MTIGSQVIATLGHLSLGGTLLMIVTGRTTEYTVLLLDGSTLRTDTVRPT